MAESQKRIAHVIALDVKPKTFRSGGPGAHVEYIAIVKNLSKQPVTWPVAAQMEPADEGVTVEDTAPIQLEPGHAMRYTLTVVVGANPTPGEELHLVVTVGPLTVRRTFTVSGGEHHHPR